MASCFQYFGLLYFILFKLSDEMRLYYYRIYYRINLDQCFITLISGFPSFCNSIVPVISGKSVVFLNLPTKKLWYSTFLILHDGVSIYNVSKSSLPGTFSLPQLLRNYINVSLIFIKTILNLIKNYDFFSMTMSILLFFFFVRKRENKEIECFAADSSRVSDEEWGTWELIGKRCRKEEKWLDLEQTMKLGRNFTGCIFL